MLLDMDKGNKKRAGGILKKDILKSNKKSVKFEESKDKEISNKNFENISNTENEKEEIKKLEEINTEKETEKLEKINLKMILKKYKN